MLNVPVPAHFENGLCLLLEDQAATQVFFREVLAKTFPQLEVKLVQTIHEAKNFIQRSAEDSSTKKICLALIDLGLPDGSGIEVVRLLSRTVPEALVVVVTIFDDDARVFEALSAGASGYILKDDSQEAMLNVLGRISSGEPPLSPLIARKLVKYFHAPAEPAPQSTVNLTPRESQTLSLLAKGMTVIEAAENMKLSPQTVAGYVKIIYQKLHVSNRAEATREAIRRGLA